MHEKTGYRIVAWSWCRVERTIWVRNIHPLFAYLQPVQNILVRWCSSPQDNGVSPQQCVLFSCNTVKHLYLPCSLVCSLFPPPVRSAHPSSPWRAFPLVSWCRSAVGNHGWRAKERRVWSVGRRWWIWGGCFCHLFFPTLRSFFTTRTGVLHLLIPFVFVYFVVGVWVWDLGQERRGPGGWTVVDRWLVCGVCCKPVLLLKFSWVYILFIDLMIYDDCAGMMMALTTTSAINWGQNWKRQVSFASPSSCFLCKHVSCFPFSVFMVCIDLNSIPCLHHCLQQQAQLNAITTHVPVSGFIYVETSV